MLLEVDVILIERVGELPYTTDGLTLESFSPFGKFGK